MFRVIINQYADSQVLDSTWLIVADEDEIARGLGITIHSRNGRLQRIDGASIYRFVLYGEDGYNSCMFEINDCSDDTLNRILMCDYYSH